MGFQFSRGKGAVRMQIPVLISLVVVLTGWAFLTTTPAAAQELQPRCGGDVSPEFEPVEKDIRTLELKRRMTIFSVKPIEYMVRNCRLEGAWPLNVYGATLSNEQFSATLVAKTADTASVIMQRLDPQAFPPGTTELSLAVNEAGLSFATSIVVTRQYTNWILVALTCLIAVIVGFALLALRAAWAGGGPSSILSYFAAFKNYALLLTGVPAVWGVYKLQYEQATAWEGLGNDFIAIGIAACAAFITAGTATTAATGLGAKT